MQGGERRSKEYLLRDKGLKIRVGMRLFKLRTAQGVDQQTMAKLIGVSPSQLSQVEKGKKGLTAANLAKAAEILHVPVSVLMADVDINDQALIDISKFFSVATRAKRSKHYEAIMSLVELDLKDQEK